MLPPNLGDYRQALFDPAEPVTYTTAEFAIYWPFVSNVWRQSAGRSNEHEVEKATYCYCRCRCDATRVRSQTKGKRKRNFYASDCAAALKITYVSGERVRVERSKGHGHDLAFMDKRGISNGLRVLVGSLFEVLKNKTAVVEYLQTGPHQAAFAEAGGTFVSTSLVRSIVASAGLVTRDEGRTKEGTLDVEGGSADRQKNDALGALAAGRVSTNLAAVREDTRQQVHPPEDASGLADVQEGISTQ